ncbi:tetratricopeptide repeat protein, partial [Verrucomicrobiota bacterium]
PSAIELFSLTTVSVCAEIIAEITTADKKITGAARWLKASRVYVVTVTKKGTTGSSIEHKIPLHTVVNLRVKEPANLQENIAKVMRGDYSTPVSALEKIVDKYEMLVHDVAAAGPLAKCYLKMGKTREAYKTIQKVLESNPRGKLDEFLGPVYLEILLALKKSSELEKAIQAAIEEGGRGLAAKAQIIRGDLYKQQGNLDEALIDGYLRTVLLFAREKDAQPEALYKAVKCLEDLRRTANAEKLRKKLLVEYPRSSYTQKIKIGT